ncbi:MAG TPA: hypothetical protein VNZ45_15190 [Bacteroidia bacterium]|jgi:antitoxin component YwqK of YwqJK toxin-antitoxin module|nr:hypothetical protein [Bacteroidia bacterium]
MRKLLLIFLFLTNCSLSLLAQQDSGFVNKAEAKNQTVNGLKEGKWIEYMDIHKSYIKEEKGAEFYCLSIYNGGKANGLQRYYIKTGKLMNTTPMRSGKRDGVVKEYYESGKLLGTYPYKNDSIEGIVRTYYENGNLRLEATYSGGKKNGPFKTYRIDGKLDMVRQYTNDMISETINHNPNEGDNKPLNSDRKL